MTKARSKAHGFSLVELVIVVVIIGVIAAIAVPRISRGARGAGDSALRASLGSLRNAIDMYAAEHSGNFPAGADQAAIETKLTEKTDGTGAVNADPTKNIYGPYLRTGFPPLSVCTNRGSTDIEITVGTPVYTSGGKGWVYATDTGKIIANCQDTEKDESEDQYNQY